MIGRRSDPYGQERTGRDWDRPVFGDRTTSGSDSGSTPDPHHTVTESGPSGRRRGTTSVFQSRCPRTPLTLLRGNPVDTGVTDGEVSTPDGTWSPDGSDP